MVSLIVNGGRIQCPDQWDDCSLRLFQRIVNDWQPDIPVDDRQRLPLFSILVGKNYEFVMGSNYEFEGLIHAVTQFVVEEGIPELPVPDTYRIGDRFVTIGKNLGQMTIGQNIQARQAMGAVKDIRAAMSIVTAIYIQPYYDAKASAGEIIPAQFSLARAKEIEPLILDLPITQIYPVGFFLLTRLQNSGMMYWLRWPLSLAKKIRDRLLLHRWRRSINWPVIMNFQ